jgi:hypothetical protein
MLLANISGVLLQDVTIADLYFEQSGDWGQKIGFRPVFLRGPSSSDIPAGSITISQAKAMAYDTNVMVETQNWAGNFTWMFPTLANNDDPRKTEWIFNHTGSAQLNVNLIGVLGELPLRFISDSSANLAVVRFPNITAQTQAAVGTARAADAFDKQARLVQLDAQFYPELRNTIPKVSAPTVVPPGGTFAGPINVILLCGTASVIRYTLDGSDPLGSGAMVVPVGTVINMTSSATLRVLGTHPLRQTSDVVSVTFTIAPSLNGAQTIFPDSLNVTSVTNYGKLAYIGTQFMPTVPGYINRVRAFTTPAETGVHIVRLWTSGIPQPIFERPYLATLLAGPYEWSFPNTTGWIHFDIPPLPLEAGRAYIVDISTNAAGFGGIRMFDPGYFNFSTSGHLLRTIASTISQGDPWMTPWGTDGARSTSLRDIVFYPDSSFLAGPAVAAPQTPSLPVVLCDNTSLPILFGQGEPGTILSAIAEFPRGGQRLSAFLGSITISADGRYTLQLPDLDVGAYRFSVVAQNNFGLSNVSMSGLLSFSTAIPDPTCNATLLAPSAASLVSSPSNLGWIAAVVVAVVAAICGVTFFIWWRKRKQ